MAWHGRGMAQDSGMGTEAVYGRVGRAGALAYAEGRARGGPGFDVFGGNGRRAITTGSGL
jgi:hypothetical protein